MYTLGAGIWRRITQKTDYFIVIVGLDNAGKTTFLEQIKSRLIKDYGALHPERITSTVGLNVAKLEIGQIQLNFWDLGGQHDLRCLWDKYFEDSNALIFLIDASDAQRFDEVSIAFNRIMENEFVQKMPVLVVCNKFDLDECAASVSHIRKMTTDEDRHRGDLALLTVSALHGTNIDRCVRWLCTALVNMPTKNGMSS